LVLVDGTGNAEYFRQGLSAAGATLGAGQFLVVGNATVTGVLPPGVLSIDETGDWIQNGAPDGVALIDTSTNTLVDALSYEGSITSCTITGFPAPVSLVEGTPFPGADTNDNLHSLARSPNGQDTDDANADWQLTTTITPGAANP